jgi:hypothetical protein
VGGIDIVTGLNDADVVLKCSGSDISQSQVPHLTVGILSDGEQKKNQQGSIQHGKLLDRCWYCGAETAVIKRD